MHAKRLLGCATRAPTNLLRIRRGSFDFEPDLGPEPNVRSKGPDKFVTDPAGNLRFRTGFGPKAGPNPAQNIWHGARKPEHSDSERLWADFGVFRRRSETFKLRDSSAELEFSTAALYKLVV